MAIVSTTAPPKCDANTTKVGVTDWGTHGIPCQTTRGLRAFLDHDAVTRFYCSVPDHRLNVERRFGRLETVEPCYFCKRLSPVLDGTYTRVSFGSWGVVPVCDDCSEKGRQDYDDPERDD